MNEHDLVLPAHDVGIVGRSRAGDRGVCVKDSAEDSSPRRVRAAPAPAPDERDYPVSSYPARGPPEYVSGLFGVSSIVCRSFAMCMPTVRVSVDGPS